jgi:hypothetical protein
VTISDNAPTFVAMTTTPGGIVAVRLSLGLESANPAIAPLTTTSVQSDSHRNVSQIT